MLHFGPQDGQEEEGDRLEEVEIPKQQPQQPQGPDKSQPQEPSEGQPPREPASHEQEMPPGHDPYAGAYINLIQTAKYNYGN